MSVAKRSPPRGEPYVEPPMGVEPAPDALPQEPSVARSLIRVGDDSGQAFQDMITKALDYLIQGGPVTRVDTKM